MTHNTSRNRHFRTMRRPSQRWAFYESQPAAVRTWFQQFPANAWPGSYNAVTPDMMADAERRHLAGLRDVWGPDHPAVQDAARRIAVRRNKIISLATPDDLLADF